MNPAKIADDCVVLIHYQLTLDDGQIADSSFGGEPLAYLHGHGNIVPGLEDQLAGRTAGETVQAVVEPADGYGEFDPAAEQVVPRSAFPKGARLEVGMGFQGEDEEGAPMPLYVRAIAGDKITITANHPLAGQRLSFKVEVLEVRKATKEELSHGHVHGPGGHHH